ncbi:hypothetical protein NDU88_006160 [Pleurodeles waltl]|uniref:Uncharacterized protein n=1 Tax=Pleurodeles waltl TaxID=8319 RepID=A0AAV7LNA1_PLEWA|nr:hypothetical protein NDU88_006160 [Pleurodeles waltl]
MGVDSILDCFFSAIGFGRVPFRSMFRVGKLVRISEKSSVLFAFGIGLVTTDRHRIKKSSGGPSVFSSMPVGAWSARPRVSSRLMERTPFRFCPKCHKKYPYTDQHLVCNLCLSPEHKEDTCEACRAFRSRKTLRDRRARRLQMASAPTGQERFEEGEETFSTQESDSEEIDPEETPKTVSKTSKPRTQEKTLKPPPTGHGLTRKIGDRSSAPKKGELVSKSSNSGRDTGTQQSRARDSGSEKIRHRDSGTKTGRHRESTTPKVKKVSSEPKRFRYRNIRPRNRKQVPTLRNKDCPHK